MNAWIWGIVGILLTPVVAGLVGGIDRVITAKMQGRMGPPVLQPFYDVMKLFSKQNLVLNRFHHDLVICSLIFTVAAVGLLFAGENLLMCIFALVVGNVFLVLAAYSTNSPYSMLGADRELLQMLAAEPMILLAAVGIYMATGTFDINLIASGTHSAIQYLPGVFFGLIYVLTIKLRKSPFDLSTSHHAHQELVKGLSTEFAGPSLALFEIIHWYETVFVMALIYLFFASRPIVGIVAVLIVYFLEILIDNINARVKWDLMLASAWVITLIFGLGNLMLLFILK
ncbi:MAG: Ech hydrogenase subunit EchB [Gammaproteobacteria bacterium GWF2_41_13]|nr:MAG: Ech hydrogenase subunit EchB [Gammaproteobacteria bacterium GWF2_41_13]